MFPNLWLRKAAHLRQRWGVAHKHGEDQETIDADERPGFHGELRARPTDGKVAWVNVN